ncbi:MAG: hypothetical protein M3R43_08235 [Acidobacteriota bacterium]|nr:hypothetical protein [Acidobacteriota bacterium]
MNKLSPQRKKVVVLAAGMACWSVGGPILVKGHPRLTMVWIGFILVALVYTVVEFVKLKRQER